MRQRVAEPGLRGTLSQAEVTRVLAEERWIQEDAEEIPGNIVNNRRTVAFRKSGGVYAVAGIIAVNLRRGCVLGGADIVQRIGSAFHEHVKFI